MLVEGLMRVKLNASDCKKEQIVRRTASAMMEVLIVKLQFWLPAAKNMTIKLKSNYDQQILRRERQIFLRSYFKRPVT